MKILSFINSSSRSMSRILKTSVLLLVAVSMATCGVDMPKEKQTSFETMTVDTTNIEVPVKFSAKMKGQSDVTIMPQVSGQLMKIYVTEGQQVRRGQTLNAVASLTQPIYAQGQLKANLKIKQLAEEDLMNKYVQTVIDAGSQVNEALADCQAAVEKHDYYHRQVAVLKDAYRGTHELMDNGKASYLEVLTAQESLLNAQLNEAMNMYNGAQGIIALYIALGGGTR